MRRFLLVGVVFCVAAIAGASACFRGDVSNAAEGGAGDGRLSPPGKSSSLGRRSISAMGRLEPKGTVLKIAAPAGNEGSPLKSLLVREGDRVAAGTLLGTLDTSGRRLASVAQERARLSTAIARLNQVKVGAKQGEIESARAVVAAAEFEVKAKWRELERLERLTQRRTASEIELDNARLAHDRATASLQQAKAQLDAVSEVRTVDVAVAEAETQLARTSLALAESQWEETQLRAPCDGAILRIHTRPGEQISSNGFLEMGQIDKMQAVAEVFEGDVPQVAVGASAVVTIDANGATLTGRVCEIGFIVARKTTLTNDPVSDTDARVVEVRIDLDDPRTPWLTRMSNARIQAKIEVAEENVAP